MATSAEQVHHGRLETRPQARAGSRLYVDLDVCQSGECRRCEVGCSYFYHPGNNGMISVAELAACALVCRRCEQPHCVAACPQEALEQRQEGERLLVRHNMRCVSCRSCSHACPYGTIYPELVPLLVHNCDFCLDRRNGAGAPVCIGSCPYGALALRDADGDLGENTFPVGDDLVVRSTHWMREKA